jgi:adenylosuccinate synthase
MKLASNGKRNIWVNIGAGYGDEGKGLMADYFCNENTINVKVNGGAQAGHTVCSLPSPNNSLDDSPEYKRFIFRQLGSGTFKGASTYLGPDFMVNFGELLLELKMIKSQFGIEPTVYIDKNAIYTLPIHIKINEIREGILKHGSCGLGIYETFHSNERRDRTERLDVNNLKQLLDFDKDDQDDFSLLQTLDELSANYLETRLKELESDGTLKLDIPEEGLRENTNFKKVMAEVHIKNVAFIQALKEVFDNNKVVLVNGLDEIPNIENTDTNILFECSQGLELDMNQSDNAPHLTPSNTGVTNVVKILNKCNKIDWSDVHTELVFILRSYMTKHGNGDFRTGNDIIQSLYNLYDRTNVFNSFQGSIRYGLIDPERTQRLMYNQLAEFQLNMPDIKDDNLTVSMTITHLDQTNNKLLTVSGEKSIKDLDLLFRFDNKAYLSYGETANTIYEYEY